MAKLVFKKCRLAIQVCVGHLPDGRERHRTFSLTGIKEGAEALASVVRALRPLLAHPITLVRVVRVYELISDRVGEWSGSGQGSRFTARANGLARASMLCNVSPGILAGRCPLRSFGYPAPTSGFWGAGSVEAITPAGHSITGAALINISFSNVKRCTRKRKNTALSVPSTERNSAPW